MEKDGRTPEQIVKENDWEVTHPTIDTQILEICKKIVENSPKQLEDYKIEIGRRERVLKWFVGQAMKEIRGKGNPEEISKVIVSLLEELSKDAIQT